MSVDNTVSPQCRHASRRTASGSAPPPPNQWPAWTATRASGRQVWVGVGRFCCFRRATCSSTSYQQQHGLLEKGGPAVPRDAGNFQVPTAACRAQLELGRLPEPLAATPDGSTRVVTMFGGCPSIDGRVFRVDDENHPMERAWVVLGYGGREPRVMWRLLLARMHVGLVLEH